MNEQPNNPDGLLADIINELDSSMLSIMGYSQSLLRAEIPTRNKADVHAICTEAKRCYNKLQDLTAFLKKKEIADDPDHILVVDDEASIQQVMCRFLSQRGYKVSLAANVDQAIRNLAERSFNLIISDYEMPHKTGGDLYHFVKENHPDLVDKFILITGSAVEPSARRFISENGIRVLEKPFHLSKLGEVIEQFLKI